MTEVGIGHVKALSVTQPGLTNFMGNADAAIAARRWLGGFAARPLRGALAEDVRRAALPEGASA
jgi:hypothetical protein